MENIWTSLCRVRRPDRHGDIWMERIADVKNGQLVLFQNRPDKDSTGDNRWLIFCSDGPSQEGTIGFWKWSEYTTDSYAGKNKIRTKAEYVYDRKVTEVVFVRGYPTLDALINRFSNGIAVPAETAGHILLVPQSANASEAGGLLCEVAACEQKSRVVKSEKIIVPKEDTYVFPCYKINKREDVILWIDSYSNRERYFYKYDNLGKVERTAFVQKPFEVIRNWVIQWANGQNLNEESRGQLQSFLKKVPADDLCGKFMKAYQMSREEAEKWIEKFYRQAQSYLKVEDIDAQAFVEIVQHHSGLKAVLLDKVDVIFAAEKEKQIQEANRLSESARLSAEKWRKEAATYQKQIDEMKEKKTIEEQKLSQILDEIEQYESIANEVKTQAEGKKENVVVPASVGSGDMANLIPGWTCRMLPAFEANGDLPDVVCGSWRDKLSVLKLNLEAAGVGGKVFTHLLASYLYAAYIHRMDLLLAGPSGIEIAEAMALALTGKTANVLSCRGEFHDSAIQRLQQSQSVITIVEHPFHQDWLYEMIKSKQTCAGKMFIWVHPFREDLIMEPQGVYHYVLPVLTECFLQGRAELSKMKKKKTSGKYEKYVASNSVYRNFPGEQEFKMSRLLSSRFKRILTDAHAISKSSSRDMDYLLALLPLAVLTGNEPVLDAMVRNEKAISPEVRTEITRTMKDV